MDQIVFAFRFIGVLWKCFPSSRLLLVVNSVVIFLAPIAELISVGALFPLLNKLMDDSTRSASRIFLDDVYFFKISELSLNGLVAAFIFIASIGLIARLSSIYIQERFVRAFTTSSSRLILENLLYQTQGYLSQRASSEWSALILLKCEQVIKGVANDIIVFTCNTVFLSVVLLMLSIYAPTEVLYVGVGLLLVYFVLIISTKFKSERNAKELNILTDRIVQKLSELNSLALQIILDEQQSSFIRSFYDDHLKLKNVNLNMVVIREFPRPVFETIVLISVCLALIVFSGRGYDYQTLVPLFGALALAAYRTIPIVNQLYRSFTAITFFADMSRQLKEQLLLEPRILKDVGHRCEERKSLNFQSIEVEFSKYVQPFSGQLLFEGLDLKIEKAEKVLITGETGVGKSTLMKIFSGTTFPDDRCLKIDGNALTQTLQIDWFKQISYVPQNVYLENASLIENIIFGKDDSDNQKQTCLELLKITGLDSIYEQRFSNNQTIGENGSFLSGGQRQRLAICRALFKKPSVLLLDEATSGLDTKTETFVLDNIASSFPDMTIIAISHNLSLTKYFDKILHIQDRKIKILTV